MATLMQLRRGTTAQHSSFIGALAEITMDTVLKTLRVHDGSTPGGFALMLAKDYNGTFKTKALTEPKSIPYATNIAIDAAQSNVFYVGTLTGNASLNIANGTDGQTINVRFKQDATQGNRTVIFTPTAVKADGAILTGTNRVTWLILTWVASEGRWEGAWSGVPA